jgi:hypothetical protein
MIEQNTVRGEWIRYEIEVLNKVPGMSSAHTVRKEARIAFLAGCASMFRLCMVNVASEPTAEKQQAAKQRLAEELNVLAVEKDALPRSPFE